MDGFQRPEDRCGDDGQPAVVDYQVEARGYLLERGLFLRTGVEADSRLALGTRRNFGDWNDHTSLEDVAAFQLAHVELARGIFLGYHGGDEVMLDHGQPAVVGRLGELGLVVGNGAEIDLLVLLGLGKYGRTGEGRYHRRLACRRHVIALQLEVSVRSNRLVAAVGDFPVHIDQVGTTLEGQHLGHLDAVLLGGFQANLQFFGSFSQFGSACDAGEGRTMGRQTLADQAALRHVLMLGIKQDEVSCLVVVFLVFQQFQADQIAALRGNGRLQQIGADGKGFGC